MNNPVCDQCIDPYFPDVEEIQEGLYRCMNCGHYFEDESYLEAELELKEQRIRKKNFKEE